MSFDARPNYRRTGPGAGAGPLIPIASADELAAAFLLGYGPATRDAYRRDLGAWFARLEQHDVDPLATHRAYVETWCQLMEQGGKAPATVARRLAALSGFYSCAEDEA